MLDAPSLVFCFCQANIVKLPNVSASVPQLTEAVAELTKKGYPLPPFTLNPTSEEDKDNYARNTRAPTHAGHSLGRGTRSHASAGRGFARRKSHNPFPPPTATVPPPPPPGMPRCSARP